MGGLGKGVNGECVELVEEYLIEKLRGPAPNTPPFAAQAQHCGELKYPVATGGKGRAQPASVAAPTRIIGLLLFQLSSAKPNCSSLPHVRRFQADHDACFS